jgi:hypothetical protein
MQFYMHEEMPPPPKGSKPVNINFPICAMLLAVASAIVMVAFGDCKPSSNAAAFTCTRSPPSCSLSGSA